MGAFTLSVFGFVPLGALASGALGDSVGADTALLTFSVAVVAIGILSFRMPIPVLERIESPVVADRRRGGDPRGRSSRRAGVGDHDLARRSARSRGVPGGAVGSAPSPAADRRHSMGRLPRTRPTSTSISEVFMSAVVGAAGAADQTTRHGRHASDPTCRRTRHGRDAGQAQPRQLRRRQRTQRPRPNIRGARLPESGHVPVTWQIGSRRVSVESRIGPCRSRSLPTMLRPTRIWAIWSCRTC